MKYVLPIITALLLGMSPAIAGEDTGSATSAYFDNSGRDDLLSGGVKMIPISTPVGEFKVWTKRIGNNPRIKMLLLHGGPGFNHEYLEIFDSYLPGAGIEYYYYDQLGSFFSDQPDDPALWTVERFVEEVEQVRVALGLNKDNFYLWGVSWGGILAIEYALKYQHNLKAVLISNMMASIPAYNEFAEKVLFPQIAPEVLREIKQFEADEDYENPRYMELLMEHHYQYHILRMPPAEWPEPVTRAFTRVNPNVYVTMQGPSELGASGVLEDWDRTDSLKDISVPTLVIGAQHDTMDPAHMEWMAGEIPNARYLHCPNGSHLAMYDDTETYFPGLFKFIRDVDQGKF
jgi:proline iminopeptidase